MILTNKHRVNTTKFKKLANGKIVKQVDEQYLREDLPCGVGTCPLCDRNESTRCPHLILNRLQPNPENDWLRSSNVRYHCYF